MKWGMNAIGYDDWFVNVQFCFQWSPVISGDGHCAGMSNPLCANVGEYTGRYRDDSDKNSQGCLMQWKLSVPVDAPEWIQTVQICYEWFTDDNRGQCGGKADGLTCAVANTFTATYTDNTGIGGGRCNMRWKLSNGT